MAQSAVQRTTIEPRTEFKRGVDKRARLRRQMYVAQMASFILDAAILFLYALNGTISISASAWYVAAGVGWTAIALILSELHFNDRFRDHYLTVPQSLGSIGIELLAIYFIPEVGFYFACIIFVVLGFGALRMSARQTGVVWAYAAIGLTTVFTLTNQRIAMPMDSYADRHLALLCFVTALGRCAFTGLYGASLREALYRRGNELKLAHAKIEELAQVDELTGVLNRRYVMRALNDEMARAQRAGTPCSLAIIDIDFFKRINDSYGHPTGDEVLRGFALMLVRNMRSIDRIGRYGGEEFLVVMPDAAKDQAVLVMDRLRQIISEQHWDSVSDDLRVTLSAGIAQVRPNDAPEDTLARADAALYKAKDAGRNRVAVG
ncbi:GGDEF domain-containing protein [Bradyrhizobium guangdongense]|uniref:diguanylate cyclase n=2 Tax=Bradyrhizobium guangdongense TaxID=1325090 RepID=A0AA87WDH0_9BRAD|nr:GGDEF domain-containing protein [Bradyrhizobium guangdongense]GGI34327.1 GGDEF domain-containing protein [Bradyrhizobium guangdongense]